VSTIPGLDDITPTWLTQRLRHAGFPDVTVERVRSERIGTGQAACCARLHIDYAGNPGGAPATLIAKFQADDALSRSSCVAMGIYRREVEFYRDIAPRLTMSLPRCHYLDVDAAGEFFMILMDDLAPAQPGDQLAGCDIAVARAAVLELVGLQAPTWCDEALGQRFMEPPDGFFADMYGVYTRMLPAFVERFAPFLAADELAIIQALGDAPSAPLFQPVGRPFCLEHRDYRLDNVMIDARGAAPRLTVVDWQGMRTGRPLNDVALFLAGGLSPTDRKAAEEGILREYHAALCAAGVRDFDFAQCWHEYRRAAFAGFGLTVVSAIAVVQTERGDRMFATMAQRYARHALDVDAAALLGPKGR
jgi:hypothetical protein